MAGNRIRLKRHFSKENMIRMSQAKLFHVCVVLDI